MLLAVVAGLVALVATAVIAARAARAEAVRKASSAIDDARAQAAAEVKAAELAAAAQKKALETAARPQLVTEARRKLRDKKVDVVVANEARVAFGGDDSEMSFVTENRDERLPRAAKVDLADALLDRIKSLLG